MNNPASKERKKPLTQEIFQKRLKEADLYVTQGLFEEAKEIYESLSLEIHDWMMNATSAGRQIHPSIQKAMSTLEGRLKNLQSESKTFEESRVPLELEVFRYDLKEADSNITHGLLDEARKIYEFLVLQLQLFIKDHTSSDRQAGPGALVALNILENRVAEFQRQAEAFEKKGEPLGFDQMTRSVEDEKIILNVALAYESMGDRKTAIRTYRDLIASDPVYIEATQKIERLAKEGRKFHFNIGVVVEKPKFFFAIALLIALFFMSFLPFVKTVNNVDYFTLKNDPDITYYDDFKKVFGNDEFFLIAFEKDNIFTEENLKLISRITKDLEKIEEVEEVNSLANIDDIIGGEEEFEVRKFLEEIPSDPAALLKIRQQALKNPLYVNTLISKDGRTASIAVKVYDRPEDENYRKRVLEKTNAVLDKYRDKVDTFHLAGWTNTNLSLSQYMKKDVRTFIPLTYLFIALAIWLIFRNVILTILALITISAGVGSTMGLLGLTGITLNNVTVIIPSITMAMCLCDTVHIFSSMDKRVLNEAGGDRYKALALVLKEEVYPCFLTSVTTALGFASLLVSNIPPIQDFARIATAAMFFEFFNGFFLLPPLILLFNPKNIYQEYQAKRGLTLVLRGLYYLAEKRHVLVVIICSLIILSGGWLISKIKVDTNLIGFFKKTTPLRQSLDFVEARLGGVDTLEISVRGGERDAFKDPSNLKVVEQIQEYVKSVKGVDQTLSFVDLLKDMNESFHNENHEYYTLPESREMVAQYLLLYDSKDIEDVINNTYDHARIAIRMSIHNSSEQAKLIKKIKGFIEKMDHHGLTIRVTGRVLKDVNTIDALVDSQVNSVGIASVTIFGVIILVALRSLYLGFLSMLPNFFPILINFGIMGLFHIPLDTGTALIAAIALGISTDDTIHFLSDFKEKRSRGMSIPATVKSVIFTKANGMISSSVILCIGFSVLVFSSFTPTFHFGLLTGIIFMTAIIGDLVLNPAVIMLFGRREAK